MGKIISAPFQLSQKKIPNHKRVSIGNLDQLGHEYTGQMYERENKSDITMLVDWAKFKFSRQKKKIFIDNIVVNHITHTIS